VDAERLYIVWRDGMMILVDDDRLPLKPGEKPEMRRVRFRTLGCYPLSGAVDSNATRFPSFRRWQTSGWNLRRSMPPNRWQQHVECRRFATGLDLTTEVPTRYRSKRDADLQRLLEYVRAHRVAKAIRP
jgi:hypothetical protein